MVVIYHYKKLMNKLLRRQKLELFGYNSFIRKSHVLFYIEWHLFTKARAENTDKNRIEKNLNKDTTL